MGPRRKTSGRGSRLKRSRNLVRVLDRDGKAAPKVSMKTFREKTRTVLAQARQRGAVAVSRNGKPVAVALSPDHFVSLCVAYAMRSVLHLGR